MEWKIKDGCTEKAITKFLATGAPFPGINMLGRYHVPGSCKGWIILETDDLTAIYEHASVWGELLDWETTPVLTDKQAGISSAKVWPKKIPVDLS